MACVGFLLLASGCGQVSGFVMNESGQSYYKRGNYAAARHEFQQALMNDPYNASYAYNVAKTMALQGDIAGAEQMYQHALSVDPGHQPAYHGLSELLVKQGRQQDAQSLLQAWAATQPYEPESYTELAQLQQATGDIAGAEQNLHRALQLKPHDAETLAKLGDLHSQSGRPAEAAQYYRQSLTYNPFQSDVSTRLSAVSPQTSPYAGSATATQHIAARYPGTYGAFGMARTTMPPTYGPMAQPSPYRAPGYAPAGYGVNPMMAGMQYRSPAMPQGYSSAPAWPAATPYPNVPAQYQSFAPQSGIVSQQVQRYPGIAPTAIPNGIYQQVPTPAAQPQGVQSSPVQTHMGPSIPVGHYSPASPGTPVYHVSPANGAVPGNSGNATSTPPSMSAF